MTAAGGHSQRWVQRDDAFVAVRLENGAESAGLVEIGLDGEAGDDLADRLGAARVDTCAGDATRCSRLLPGVFAHCPFCGEAATPPAARPDDGRAAAAWSRAIASGSASLHAMQLTVLPGDGAAGAGIDAAKRSTLPSAGPFLFAMAGTPPFTVAVDVAGGVVWRPGVDDWRRLAALDGRCGLPAWSRSAAPLGAGLAVPLDDGAVWVELDGPFRRRVRVDGGAAIGGAIAVEGMALVPLRADGRLALAWMTDAEAGWSVAAVPAAPAGTQAAAIDALGKPVSAVPGTAVWAGAAGCLSVRVGPQGPLAVWRDWPAGCRGLPWSRPHLGEHAIPHQLVRLEDGGGYLAVAMPPPNSRGALPDAVQSARVDGPFVTTGDTAFYLHLRCRGLPWRRDLGDFAPPGSIVLPLMAFSRGAAAGSGEQILYATVPDPGVVTGPVSAGRSKATLFLLRPGLELAPLLSGLPVATLHDLQPFLLDGRLCLYDEPGAVWHRWDLSPVPTG
ncbi:hypothetical protein [Azospirillum sp. TSO35-2]|uniref:hypothetical protein n=1 Tax=Azospirillum sp. TSO35-2 TaxID=716796 RepID=UPI000D60E039|nr:hypothetical protein [Azospirillum sp. TSO35-2]PWC40965.1 hypothetical protein TSO352_00525 [Azospirillum sp. TSO35-2]